jgi:hypothetical protein
MAFVVGVALGFSLGAASLAAGLYAACRAFMKRALG